MANHFCIIVQNLACSHFISSVCSNALEGLKRIMSNESYQTGIESDGLLLGVQPQVANNNRTNKSLLYFQVGVIACAILFGFVCGVFYSKAPVSYYKAGGALRRKQRDCAMVGEHCGGFDSSEWTECCGGATCGPLMDPFTYVCHF